MKHFFTVGETDNGTRLDVFIAGESDELSRARVKNIIADGGVSVDGTTVTKAGYAIKSGQSIVADIGEPRALEAFAQNIPIKIVYQDADIAVIDKAQGMVTHPAMGSPSDTLVNALLYHIDDLSTINGIIRPGIVHRLDKNTSGLIVIAKNDAAHNSLAKQIAEKSAKRYYTALVDGNIKEDAGIVEQPIGRSKSDRKKMAVRPDGRYAKTIYKVAERFGTYTLVEFELFTGRTHQIRVHAAYLHHPITGDTVYGGSNKFGLSGQLLHAHKLELCHPTNLVKMSFCAELPSHFVDVLEILRKTSSR